MDDAHEGGVKQRWPNRAKLSYKTNGSKCLGLHMKVVLLEFTPHRPWH